ncbi:uncharacterized protein STEHIDRAFT_168738 [Stereum hirsutum FP-91666 SS1]|uniref:uncharacterized protein n=1 Tax=Stereum hirsutum (strain FP-91666) TaxID=721885 RepID=UPI0004449D3A|nr:uncharacterized protein STEHIDRAFT_168738 [Stereum hirsutum FP-91666 SS1]EIM86850.1 hypothetical protein STEHIDRAFT_168738 [Stereum hirsutum FP-91666 SS1]
MAPITDISYDLPAILKAVQSSWISSSQSAAAVSALIVLLDAQLLTFMKAQPPLASRANVDQSVQDVMLGFVYSGLLLNIGATVSSLIITEMFGEMPLNAARSDPETLHAQGRLSASTADLLARYGVSRGVRSITWHWFLSLFLGILCSMIGVLMYVWTTEPLVTRIVMTVVAVFSVFPFIHYVVR